METEKVHLTPKQEKRIIRNDKIVKEFTAMKGSIIARYDILAKRHRVSRPTIQRVVEKSNKNKH